MADLKQLQDAIQVLQAGLTMADMMVGWVGRIPTPERRARYARWRALRLELRAEKAKIRGWTRRFDLLEAKQKVWAKEADRLELELSR